MARKPKEDNAASAELLKTALSQISTLWESHNPVFFEALDDSDKKRLQLNFAVTLDLSEAAAVVDVQMRFKDNDTEKGMEVTKTFKASLAERLDDPSQPRLPGMAKNNGQDGDAEEEAFARGKSGKKERDKKPEAA